MPKTMRKAQKYTGAKGRKTQGRANIDKTKIKSAAELGVKAESLGIGRRAAKTHKGRKIMEARNA